jgi:hypothetical protein
LALTLSIHNKLKLKIVTSIKILTQYDCKEVCAQTQSQVTHLQDPAPLSLPQFNRLVEVSFVWDESSASSTDVTVIPSQFKVTKQILFHCQPFRDLNLKYVGSRHVSRNS